MADKVKEVVKEEAVRIKTETQNAVQSGGYLYPFRVRKNTSIVEDRADLLQGIFYFFTHRSLWKPLLNKLAPTITLGIGVTTFMFAFTYVPQAAVLAIFNGPLAVVSAILLVLSESSTLISVLAKTFVIEDSLIDTFDGVSQLNGQVFLLHELTWVQTLASKNMNALVSEGRIMRSSGDPMSRLGKIMKRPFERFTPSAVIRYFLYLPLNFIPVVGTVLFIVAQGRKFGPNAHARYFQLKLMNKRQREEWIEQRKAAYTR